MPIMSNLLFENSLPSINPCKSSILFFRLRALKYRDYANEVAQACPRITFKGLLDEEFKLPLNEEQVCIKLVPLNESCEPDTFGRH